MVHLFSYDNLVHTVFYASLTYFITPYILVERFGIINMKNSSDPCMYAFIIGFIFSLISWNIFTKHNVY